MNSGFHDLAGCSATAKAAAWAKRLESPITKSSKVNLGLSGESPREPPPPPPPPAPLAAAVADGPVVDAEAGGSAAEAGGGVGSSPPRGVSAGAASVPTASTSSWG